MLNIPPSDLKYILQILKEYSLIEEAVIFGSRAKGNPKKGSDIDMALKGNHLDAIVLEISGRLNDEGPLPYKVDVLDYKGITNSNLKDHIDRVGVRIYPENSNL